MPDSAPGYDGLNLQFRFGASVVAEFVLSHTPADVLRELVQNEFDAGGTELVIEFCNAAIVVRGNGTPIDSSGWKRLSVVLGTGAVAGQAERIDPKTNGIGSKNFGMRSLFLFGDTIHIASGGRKTILDCIRGAADQPVIDLLSAGAPGVVITVPYREASDGPLPIFDEARELEALKTIATQLAPTLVKLAQPGARKNLRTVVVRSERFGQEVRWDQTARRVPGSTGVVRRTIRVKASRDLLGDAPDSISEIEHQIVLVPPPTLPKLNIPDYFRVAGGRIRLGLSARLRRGRLDLDSVGLLYYPLGAAGARTGFPFSVSAPFSMNEDRSNIIDIHSSPWNAWLLEQAARFAVKLLPTQLFSAYGADAYVALDPRRAATSAIPVLRDEIDRLLRTEQCWPTRARRRGGAPKLSSARDNLVVPENRALKELVAVTITDEKVLHDQLTAHPGVSSLATTLGAKKFTLGSLVRMRCAGADNAQLATRLEDDEANWHYLNFPDALNDLRRQRTFAAALDAHAVQLRPAHKTDLRRAPATMTAAETLAAPADVWLVDEALADVIPKHKALHPELAEYRILGQLCGRFNASKWAIELSGQIAYGVASSEERDALVAYLRAKPNLSKKAWAAVRQVQILPDRNGTTVAAVDMVSSAAKGASLLAPAIHLPLPEDEANESLRPLRFRTKLISSDLVALARVIEQGDAPPKAIRSALTRLPELLTRSALTQLKGIRFVATASGTLVTPGDSYLRSDRMVAVMGDDAPYAEGLSAKLLSRLGARSEPAADDIVAALGRWRDAGELPGRPELVYRALADALHRERLNAKEVQDKEILWTGNRWQAPADCLVGSENRKTFLGAVTVLASGQRDVWKALGVPVTPTDNHWSRLLVWTGARYGQRKVPQQIADSLRRAYRELDEMPWGIPHDTKCLLDDRDRLRTIGEAVLGRFLINDNPALATSAAKAGAQVSFAAPLSGKETSFLVAAGARRLSEVATRLGYERGTALPTDKSLHADATLERLRSPNFASGVAALLDSVLGAHPTMTPIELATRLAQIEEIAVVEGIQERYQLVGEILYVPVNYAITGDRVFVNRVPNSYELRRAVADAVAEMADVSSLSRRVLPDAIYFLLRCRSSSEMKRELERRNVFWRPVTEPNASDFDDQEDDESAPLIDHIGRAFVRNAISQPVENTGVAREPAAVPRNPRPPLPDIRDVNPQPAGPRGKPQDPATRQHYGGGGQGGWAPRDDQARAEDEELGRRGEKFVLDVERRRVEELGCSPDRVTWTADDAPLADHDIKSVDEDGEDLWIEVKTTRGRDGRFSWPRAEFSLAVRVRRRYVLYRVYEADTKTPQYARIPDPISLFETGDLQLDLDEISADVGPLVEPEE